MKTNIKHLVVISSVALMASGSALAQNQSGQDSSQISEQSQSTARDSAVGAAGQARPSEGAIMDEPAGAEINENRNWGWIGLLGLTGLFGLKRHHDERDTEYRTARTNP